MHWEKASKQRAAIGASATYLSDLSFLSAGLSHCDLPQETVICVDNYERKWGKKVYLINAVPFFK